MRKLGAGLSLVVLVAWAFLAVTVAADYVRRSRELEQLGRRCAELYGERYAGKTCQQLQREHGL